MHRLKILLKYKIDRGFYGTEYEKITESFRFHIAVDL